MNYPEATGAFAERLSDLIKSEKGNTLRDLAKECDVSYTSLSKYQNQSAEAGINSLVKIAKHFNVSTDYLLGLSDVKCTDTEVTAVCKHIGLTEESVNRLHNCNDGMALLIQSFFIECGFVDFCKDFSLMSDIEFDFNEISYDIWKLDRRINGIKKAVAERVNSLKSTT